MLLFVFFSRNRDWVASERGEWLSHRENSREGFPCELGGVVVGVMGFVRLYR